MEEEDTGWKIKANCLHVGRRKKGARGTSDGVTNYTCGRDGVEAAVRKGQKSVMKVVFEVVLRTRAPQPLDAWGRSCCDEGT